MDQKVEWCFQALRFTPSLLVVDAFLMLHFCVSWYCSAKKTGWKIDFWYLTLFLGVFQTVLVLYPFNASVHNSTPTLGMLNQIVEYVDQAFLISILGYVCIWAGRYIYDSSHGRFPIILFFHLTRPISQMIEKNLKSKRAIMLLASVALLLGLLVLAIQFSQGEFFNGRRFFLAAPAFRPIFNIAVSLFSVSFTCVALRFAQYREKIFIRLFLLLAIVSLFFGVRYMLIAGILNLWMLGAFKKNGHIHFKKIALFFPIFFLGAVLLSNLREGNYNPVVALSSFFFSFFYGNNFSDTRDFAWILSHWDGEFLYGKTYVAALLSFIPRSFCSLREWWGISTYTNNLIGFSSDLMPGLRPGLFGEAYLNFGLPGVMAFGLIFGFALRYADAKIKEFIINSKDLIKGYSYTLVFSLMTSLAVTAGIWAFYIFILIHFLLVPFRGRSANYSHFQRHAKLEY